MRSHISHLALTQVAVEDCCCAEVLLLGLDPLLQLLHLALALQDGHCPDNRYLMQILPLLPLYYFLRSIPVYLNVVCLFVRS